MTTYLFSVQPEGYKELTLPEGESLIKHDCARWTGVSKISTWDTPKLEWLEDEFTSESDVDADFVKFSGSVIVTSTVLEVIKPFLREQVEFLPVLIGDETRFIVNVLNVLDVMDKEKSRYKIYSDGKVGMCEHAFINEPSTTNLIYKVNGFLGRTFVNDMFVDMVNKNEFSGLLIREYKNP